MKFKKLSFSILYSVYTGIMPLIMSGLVSVWVYKNIETLKVQNIISVILIWLSFTIAMGFSIIPTTFIALVSGYIWGFYAILPLIFSYILATWLGNKLSKWIDSNQIIAEVNKAPKAKAILDRLKHEQFKIVALARLSPIFPFGISNVIFTYMGVPFKILCLAGILGMFPRTFFMVWIATKANTIEELLNSNWREYLSSPIFYIGILSLLGLIFIIYKVVIKEKP